MITNSFSSTNDTVFRTTSPLSSSAYAMISTYSHNEHYIKLKATIPVSINPTVKVKNFSILLGLQSH